jgi:hypothetical protein
LYLRYGGGSPSSLGIWVDEIAADFTCNQRLQNYPAGLRNPDLSSYLMSTQGRTHAHGPENCAR